MVELEVIELLNGILSIIVVLFAMMAGIAIMSKYPKNKKRHFLLIGIGAIGLASILWSVSISVIYVLITGNQIADQLYMFIANGFLPLISFMLVMGFTDLFRIQGTKWQKIILLVYLIISIIFEVYYLYFLFTDYSVLGVVLSPVDAEYNLIVTSYQVFLLANLLVFGGILSRISMRSEYREVRLKGKLILAALLLFSIASMLDIFSAISIVILIIGRIMVLLSAVLLYGGFLLPDWLKKIFIN